ncbi:DUF3800 domain-containing protein [Bradyrhizobium sp. WSM471]|uniref:DUF3800 domain-containing protein n=1 Tax=Bradyrhizobium sp. WSM471 TaxID=319017 RepID=UPI00024D1ED4|nr:MULTISPECIES: DUF3800 domain-containing protein [Bradyrhizobium]EHR01136.1 hypothetical protein Bra471DRAFT_01833 [Bradyrhizobium sp. WSM471]UFW43203.1 DUF3800 domain-containing protein [Bradyrhizobium canariense]
MECFRIDESGYTGFDLLNADQRFQGASAIGISDEDAARLIREHFPRIQAPELKYRSLSRRPANHERLLSLQRDLLTHYRCVTYICDKRFLLMLKFVDYAVEPFYYERGIDFYDNGQNYAMASLLTLTGPTFLGQPAYDNMLAAFQHAVKEKTPGPLEALVAAARATHWRDFPEGIGPLAQYAAPECLSAIATPGVNTDAALVVLQSLISRMEVMAEGPYRVEHDQSKNLLTYHDLLQRFIDHDQEIEFRQTEITSLKFPLKLAEVAQVDSKTSPAVQLADVMIGAAIEAANNIAGLRSGGLDPEAVMTLYADHQFIHMVPSVDFEEQRRFRQGTQAAELIDYFSVNFYGRPRES